jgi:hypothetical protein
MQTRIHPSRLARRAALLAAVAAGCTLAGCNNAVEGGLSGAGLGALAGLGIGSLFGMPGEGAAIGAIGGAVTGSVIGDQNERNAQPYNQQHRSRW